jgi:hypothetical protein
VGKIPIQKYKKTIIVPNIHKKNNFLHIGSQLIMFLFDLSCNLYTNLCICLTNQNLLTKMEKTEIKKSNEILKDRIAAVKPKLPKNYIQRLLILAPEYDTVRGYFLIRNTVKRASAHVHLTELLEKIAVDYEAETLAATSAATTGKAA